MKKRNKNFKNEGRHPLVELTWMKHIFLYSDHYFYAENYPILRDTKFAIAQSQPKEENLFNNIWKINSNHTIKEQTDENSDLSTNLSNENEAAATKNPLERSLRKYFIADNYANSSTKNERNLHAKDELKKSLIDFTAGSLAGIAQIYSSQPFDTVKVKQQTFPKRYGGMLKCFVHTYRSNGIIRGLYAGAVPAAVSSVAENSILFSAYGACQNVVTFVMEIDRVEELSALGFACAGFLAAFFSSLTMCPIELIKCKLQAVHEVKQYVDKRSTALPITTIKLTKEILANEGIAGFYRGLSSTIAREMPGYFFFFGGYEAMREFFAQPNQTKDDIGVLRTMCAGAVAGVVSWTSTYPADVIKTRIQVNNLKASMLSVGTDMLRKEGFFAFYSGLLPTILRTIPATATLFLVYEYSKKVLTEKFSR